MVTLTRSRGGIGINLTPISQVSYFILVLVVSCDLEDPTQKYFHFLSVSQFSYQIISKAISFLFTSHLILRLLISTETY